MTIAAIAGGRQKPPMYSVVVATLLFLGLVGCDLFPGRARARDQQEVASEQVAHFHALYGQQCAGCHGEDGRGGPKARSVVDPSYLALVSDQHLRTTVIAGRADLGMPDWRGYIAGRVLAPEDISDVVAWLASNRKTDSMGGSGRPPSPQRSGRPGAAVTPLDRTKGEM